VSKLRVLKWQDKTTVLRAKHLLRLDAVVFPEHPRRWQELKKTERMRQVVLGALDAEDLTRRTDGEGER